MDVWTCGAIIPFETLRFILLERECLDIDILVIVTKPY